ncbi:MAG: hypothetical protein IPK72_10995 [Candidatus Eisenbacteria bacterium]|nr:hypothetical protein [Candidatus Eisenbacteria bacterium]
MTDRGLVADGLFGQGIEPSQGGSRRGRYVAVLALLLTALLLAGNVTGLLLYRSLQAEIDRELGDRLVMVASTAAQAIGSSGMGRAGIEPESVRRELERLALTNELDNIVLVDASARTLIDLRAQAVPGDRHPLADLDPGLEATLLSGLAQSTELIRADGAPGAYLKTGFAAIESDAGEILGAIAVEGGSGFFRALTALRTRLFWAQGIGTLAVVILGTLFFRILRSFVRLEDSLRQSSALLAIGQISAVVAHEIKNPLAIIRSRSERVRAKIEAGKPREEILEWFDAIPNEVDRLNQILGNYLSLARPDQNAEGSCEVEQVMRETAALLEPDLARRGITLQTSGGEARESGVPLRAAFGARSLKQVLLNLVLNASEAIQAQGPGSTGRIGLVARRVGDRIEIVTTDDGPGMSDEARRRALEPFFTTKPTGSGLGLTLVSSLVRARGGRLRFESAAPKGTVVRLELPAPTGERNRE